MSPRLNFKTLRFMQSLCEIFNLTKPVNFLQENKIKEGRKGLRDLKTNKGTRSNTDVGDEFTAASTTVEFRYIREMY